MEKAKATKAFQQGFIGIKPEHLAEKTGISYAALGLLSMMVNVPECDYATIKQLHEFSPAESTYKIRQSLDELISADWVSEQDKRYFVNKEKMMEHMTLIGTNAATQTQE